MTVISYPTALYQNVQIESDFYQPSRFVISAITRGDTTIVTTSIDHNYVIGQLVRLLIPIGYGSRGLNEKSGYVISIPADDQVTIDIDSNDVDAFVNLGTGTQAQILAIGDINSGVQNASGITSTGTYINGSFINISPN